MFVLAAVLATLPAPEKHGALGGLSAALTQRLAGAVAAAQGAAWAMLRHGLLDAEAAAGAWAAMGVTLPAGLTVAQLLSGSARTLPETAEDRGTCLLAALQALAAVSSCVGDESLLLSHSTQLHYDNNHPSRPRRSHPLF